MLFYAPLVLLGTPLMVLAQVTTTEEEYWYTVDDKCEQHRGELWWEELSEGCESILQDGRLEVCGICTRKWYSSKGHRRNKCYHRIFWERFIIHGPKPPHQTCVGNEDHCKKQFFFLFVPSCKSHGRCTVGFSSYKCDCDSPWYGKECQYSVSGGHTNSYARGIDVLYNKRVRVTEPMTVIVATFASGDNIEVEIKSAMGKRRTLFKKSLTLPKLTDSSRKGDQLAQYCASHTSLSYTDVCKRFLHEVASDLFSTTIRFPFKREASSDPKSVFYYNDTNGNDWPIGYPSDFIVDVFNTPLGSSDRQKVFSTAYNIWVDYPIDTYCYENIAIENCESNMKLESFYTTDTIQFIGDYPDDSMPEQFEASNKLMCYRLVFEGDWKLFKDLANGDSIEISNAVRQMNFVIPRRTLSAGLYRVEFNCLRKTIHDERNNFAVCTFQVLLVPLVAVLSGGSEISVNMEAEGLLDGRKSYDPNVDEKEDRKGLTYLWTCEFVDSSEPCLVEDLSPGKIGRHSSVVNIPGVHFNIDKKYRITLEVSKEGRTSAVTSQVVNVGTGAILSIHVDCKNCFRIGSNLYADPASYIFLRAEIKFTENAKNLKVNYIWDFSADHGVTFESIDSIRVNGTGQELLKVEENKLMEGQVYYFRVKVPGSDMFAELIVQMSKLEGYACDVQPQEGVAGLTLFTINCLNLNGSANFVEYEVYDKLNTDIPVSFSGRMLGTRKINRTIENFRLVNGNVVALLYTSQKVIRSYAIEVKLTPFNGTEQDVLSIVNLRVLLQQNRNEKVVTTASVIPSVISNYKKTKSLVLRNTFLTIYKVVTIESFINITESIKLGLSSISFTLDSMATMEEELMLEADVVQKCAKVLLSLAKMLQSKLDKGVENEITLNPSTIKDMVREVFTSVEILLAIKIPQATSKPLHLVNQGLLETIQDTSHDLVKVLYQSGGTLLWQQEPGDEASKVTSKQENIIGWVKENQNFTLVFKRESNNTFPDPPISFSHEFQHFQSNFTLGTQLTTLKINAYWWGYNNINTDALLIEMCHQHITIKGVCERIHHTRQDGVYLYFNITQQVSSLKVIEGQTTQLDPEKNPYELDLELTVYRFDPPIKAKLFVNFLELKEGEEFRVLFTENTRPDFRMMNQSPDTRVISTESSEYFIDYTKVERNSFHYMGILPGTNVTQGNRVKFKVKVHYVRCKTWLEFNWGSHGCWVGNLTDDNILECVCNHFSLFGGRVDVPTHFPNPAIEYAVFLTERLNWVPSTLLVVVLLFLTLLFVLGWRKDKKDTVKGKVLILEDNYPGERYIYLLGVYTGSRLASGTQANVGVKLFGEKFTSRPHILKSSVRRTLLANSDDWFLMYCPRHLGALESLQIWHDNSGRNPDWFVEKIVVFDLTKDFQYMFHFNVWITLEVDEYPEAIVAPVTTFEFFGFENVFLENFVHGFRDTHHWTSVFWKHPRNPVSRVRRVCVLTCFILVAMSVSLIICTYFEGTVKEDEPVFSFRKVDLMICLVAFIAASLIECPVMFLFRKSFIHDRVSTKSTFYMRRDSISDTSLLSMGVKSTTSYKSPMEYFFEERKARVIDATKGLQRKFKSFFGQAAVQRRQRTTFDYFAWVIYLFARGSSLEPVRLNKSVLKKNRSFLIPGYVFCFIIISTSVIVVAYVGVRLTYVKSEIWVTIFLLLIVFDAMIFQTMKVLLISTILACAYQKVASQTNYNFKASDVRQKRLVGNTDLLYKILEMRIKPMYCPLNEITNLKYREKRVLVTQWKMLIDFVVVLLLIFVLIMVTTLSKKNYFLSNDHAASMLLHDHDRRHPDFEDALNRTHLEDFLIHGFINQLYKSMWYNDFALNDQNGSERGIFWTDDGVVRLLGNARVRQLRMELRACPKIENTTLGEFCCPSWSPGAEAKDVYDVGWLTGGYKDRERKSSAWRYTGARHSNSSAGYGPTRTLYHAGGYIQDLGSTKADAVVAVSLLRAGGWLDHMTRAVFLELSLYNANTELFSHVTLVAEVLPSGELLTAAHVNSVNIRLSYNIWNISFFIFQLFFFVRMCVLMNRNGVFNYLSDLLNAFEVFLLGLGVFTTVLYVLHIVTSSAYVIEYSKTGTDEFFDFYKIVFYRYMTTVVFCVLFFFVVLRLLLSWRFGRAFFTIYYTVSLSLAWVVWLIVSFALLLYVVWRLVGYTVNVYLFAYYTTVVVYSKDFLASGGHGCHLLLYRLTAYFMCFLSQVVNLAFIASFAYYNKVAKAHRLIDTDSFNLFTFAKDQALVKLRNRKKKTMPV